ncbi:MAG: acyloxyacyl hydrolase [Cyclobacteriaceae bacterium]|nr:acyloxyacyl hydrolase [Cyclobacteriaceae bacterium]
MQLRFLSLVVFFSFLYAFAHAQQERENKPTYVIGMNGQYGFIIPHSDELKQISESNPWGLSADFSKLLYSDKAWSNCNCYSKIGLSFAYYNYSNPKNLGNSYNLILFAEPFLSYQEKLHTTLRAGMGVTYLDKVYDEITNPENLFYSSPISFILILQLKVNYTIDPNYKVYLSGNYNHISNGAVEKPNKGMNFPTLGLGLEYSINPVKLIKKDNKTELDKKKLFKYLRLFWNIRTVPESNEYQEKYKAMIGLEGGIMKRLSRINGLMTGLEYSYDGLFNEEIKRNELDYTPHLVSLHLGHFFIFGKFTFTQQFAWYAYKSYPFNDHEFFQRYGIYWQFGRLINCGFSLKSHGHVAEYMDVRMGITF